MERLRSRDSPESPAFPLPETGVRSKGFRRADAGSGAIPCALDRAAERNCSADRLYRRWTRRRREDCMSDMSEEHAIMVDADSASSASVRKQNGLAHRVCVSES